MPKAKSRRPCIMKTGVLTPFRAWIVVRGAANASTGASVPEYAASLVAMTPGSIRAGGSAPDEACDHAGLGKTLRDERAAEVRPRLDDLDRRPRHARNERRPDGASAEGDAPGADPCVGDVGPHGEPGEERLHVAQLVRPVDPDQATRGAVAACVDREHDVVLADEAHRPGDHVGAAAVTAEPVEQHHGGPATDRCDAVRHGQGRGEWGAVERSHGHVLRRKCRRGTGKSKERHCGSGHR